jgi:tripartite-type tricarboxylate transporter receptor subunit TctC
MSGEKKSYLKKAVILVLSAGIVFSFSSGASAQGKDVKFPARPLTMVVPYTAGGATDVEARLAASYWKKRLGFPVAVENKAGGGGAIGTREIKMARPDGYTVGCTGFPDPAVQVALKGAGIGFRNEDFAVLGAFTSAPGALTVMKDGPFKSLKDFIEYAKKNPGKLTISVSADVWLLHVMEMEEAFGIDLNPITFKGGGDAVNALLGKHVLSTMSGAHFAVTGTDKGLFPLAVTGGKKRIEKLPNTPLLTELGYDVSYEIKRIFITSAAVPKPLQNRLSSTLMELDKDPEFVEKIKGMGQIYEPSSGPELEKIYRDTNQRIALKVEKHRKRFNEQ